MVEESNRSSSNICEPREEPETIKKWKAEQVDKLQLHELYAKDEKNLRSNYILAEASGKKGQTGGGGQGGPKGKGQKGASGLVCSALGAGE